jgi:hypothetical protein
MSRSQRLEWYRNRKEGQAGGWRASFTRTHDRDEAPHDPNNEYYVHHCPYSSVDDRCCTRILPALEFYLLQLSFQVPAGSNFFDLGEHYTVFVPVTVTVTPKSTPPSTKSNPSESSSFVTCVCGGLTVLEQPCYKYGHSE